MYNPRENNKFDFESTAEDYDGEEKLLHSSQVAGYCKIGANDLKDAAHGLRKAAAGFKNFVDVFDDAENFAGFLIDEYERALQNVEKLMEAVEALDARLEALEKLDLSQAARAKTPGGNASIPNADAWRDLFRVRPDFYEWVEAETFEGGRFKAFRADSNGNGDAWRDAELKPVSPPFRWRPLPSPKKARRDDE